MGFRHVICFERWREMTSRKLVEGGRLSSKRKWNGGEYSGKWQYSQYTCDHVKVAVTSICDDLSHASQLAVGAERADSSLGSSTPSAHICTNLLAFCRLQADHRHTQANEAGACSEET
jgi:hypothetical protein